MKRHVFIFCLFSLNAAAAPFTEVASSLQQARAFMLQGNRQKAIEQLDRAKSLTRSKPQLKEISEKRAIFVEQFLTSDSFQRFQEARSLSDLQRWDECLRELEAVKPGDQDNLLVIRLRASCQFQSRQYDLAAKNFSAVLAIVPQDHMANFGLSEVAIAQKRYADAQTLLDAIEPSSNGETEKLVILKAHTHELNGQLEEAEELLNQDHEKHLDHVEVLYELGMLYTRMPGHDWPARKILSLFITRCKRMKDTELKSKKLDVSLTVAQTALAAIDKKLGV